MKNYSSLLATILLLLSLGSQAKSLSSYKYKSVSAYVFQNEIELTCGRTVDCKNHKEAVKRLLQHIGQLKILLVRLLKLMLTLVLMDFQLLTVLISIFKEIPVFILLSLWVVMPHSEVILLDSWL